MGEARRAAPGGRVPNLAESPTGLVPISWIDLLLRDEPLLPDVALQLDIERQERLSCCVVEVWVWAGRPAVMEVNG